MEEQNFSNHAKLVPAFHLFGAPVFTGNLTWSIVRWYKYGLFSFEGLMGFLVAAALLVTLFNSRIGMLGVQDRIIRLEERLRYEKLLPPDLKARIDEFTLAQLVSLRFASDAELPTLARKVLDEKLSDRKAIKRMVQNWKPDYLRS